MVAEGLDRAKNRLKMIRCVAVTGRDERPVDVQRRRRPGVPEPVGHRPHVDTLGQQLGGDEMAQVMESDVGQTCLDPESFPTAGGELGPPWLGGRWIIGEDEVIGIDDPAVAAGDELRPAFMGAPRRPGP